MRIGIMGAGSLGTIMGALLSKGGCAVELIDVNREHVKALNEKGARITGKMELTVPVKALLAEEMAGEYDCIFYLVKATHDGEALPLVQRHLKTDGVVVTMLNGIPEEKVAQVMGRERTLGCAIGWGATWVEPGVSMLTSDPEKMTYDIGELDGQDTERLTTLLDILKLAGMPDKTNNLIGLRWTKLTANATFSGMSTVIGGTYGEVLDHPQALFCAACIAREALAVVRAAGIRLQPIQGFDLGYLDFHTLKEYNNLVPVYGLIFGPHRALKASMLQDLEKGLACEINAINGAISQWAVKYGVSTPVNNKVVAIIQAIEEGTMQPGLDNVHLIDMPELPAE